MNIQGEKIILRAIGKQDCKLLLNIINDPDAEKMLGGYSFPVSEEMQSKWIEEQSNRKDILRCIIALAEKPEIGIGTLILSDIDFKNGTAQAHIKLDKEKGCGKGYGTDAMKTIVRYAFEELRLNCVYGTQLSYNIPAHRMLEKCGWQKEGILKSRAYKNGQYVDMISYSILKEGN